MWRACLRSRHLIFAPSSSEAAAGFGGFLVFCVIWSRICSRCSTRAAMSNPTEFLRVFEKFVQVEARQQRVPGPGLSQNDPRERDHQGHAVLSGASPHGWPRHLPRRAWSHQEAPSNPGMAAAGRPEASLCCQAAGVASQFLVGSPVPGTWCGFNSDQLLSRVRLSATPCTAACQASLSITNSRNLLKPMSIESVTRSNHLTLCHPLLLPPSIFPSISSFV